MTDYNMTARCDLGPVCAWLQVVEDFGLLQFAPLAIEDKESVAALVALVDKANGFVWAGLAAEGAPPPELQYRCGRTHPARPLPAPLRCGASCLAMPRSAPPRPLRAALAPAAARRCGSRWRSGI